MLALFGGILVLSGCDSASVDPTDGDLAAEIDVQNGDIIPGQYIVVLDEAKLGKAPAEVVRELTRQEDIELMHAYGTALQGFAAKMSEERAGALADDERVKYVEHDRMIVLSPCKNNPNHPKCGDDGGGDPPSNQETPWGIARVGGAGSGVGKTAWVLDTGIDLDHPDLNVDQARAWSAFTKRRDKSPDDGHGHGTHVAGTIAAIDNDIDVVGVAAGATVVPVKVLSSSGSGSTSGVIAGVDYVAANAGSQDVANMSLGGGVSQALDNAVIAASQNVKFALAAGNEGDHANNHSPARANGNNITTVAAIGQNDCLTSWSNYGVPPVDTAAPGAGILSLRRGGGTTTMSGTSMAAPHVAGILLLGNLSSDGNACTSRAGTYPIAHR